MFNHVTVLLNEAVGRIEYQTRWYLCRLYTWRSWSFKFDFKTVNNRPFILF